MATPILVATGRGLLGRLKRVIYGRQHSDFLLLLRLENQVLLTKRIGSEGLALTRTHLTMRIARVIGHNIRLQIVSPGNFAVLFPCQSSSSAMMIAEKAQERMQEGITVAGQAFSPVVTGVLLELAEIGTTQIAKPVQQARGYLESLPPACMGQIVAADSLRAKADASMRASEDKTDLVVHFHPRLCCETGRVAGFEAIPEIADGNRSPGPQVRTPQGLSQQDWRHLIRQALEALALWQNEGWNIPAIALSMTGRELEDDDLTETILREARQRHINPKRVAIGVRGIEQYSPAIAGNILKLQRAGCLFYLSGFGLDYGSFELLRKFGIRRIGIGAAYTLDCNLDPDRRRVLPGLLALAEQLRLGVIAQEVETQEEHAYLSQLGCDEVQGRAIARPMLLRDSFAFLADLDNRRSLLPDFPAVGNPTATFCRASTRSGRFSAG